MKFPCIIKMNRGSGMNRVVFSRAELIADSSLDTFRFWFSVDPYYYSREPHYSKMKPCLVVEDYLGDNLNDFKVFCFNGNPMFIQVDVDRFNGHKRVFYDLNWNRMALGMIYPKPTIEINPPVVLNQMNEIAT
ncbi:MAG: ATP-grasp fold amidoligase family protein, partial [Bacteroidota bacterium]